MQDQRRDQSRAEQSLDWNSDLAHQRLAGQARARQFTGDYQAQAGHRAYAAFSARWRAGHGLAPLSVEAAVRYVTIEEIRGPLDQPLPAALRVAVYAAWCTGRLVGVAIWLQHGHDDPPGTYTS